MSYNIGQWRITYEPLPENENQNAYEHKYDSTTETLLNNYQYKKDEDSVSIEGINIKNFCIKAKPLNSTASYYLQIGIKNSYQNNLNFILKLKKQENDTTTIEQEITNFSVPRALDENSQGMKYFEFIISPNAEYDKIVFVLQRDSLLEENTININNFEVKKISELKNLIKSSDTIKYITKIGIQGPPSLIFCINREPIRLGRNGIYEMNNNLKIDSINVVPKNENDYLIIDYEYDEKREGS